MPSTRSWRSIKRTIQNNGKVLIPVFSVGRGQEIQLVLENYMTTQEQYKLDVPVYLDGMILEASAIHTAYPEYLKESLREQDTQQQVAVRERDI